MNVIKKGFGNRLKILRKSQNLTQEKLAEKIGINLRQLARIEAGERFVTADTLFNICKVLGISPNVLFEFEIQELEKKEENMLLKTLEKNIYSISNETKKIEFLNLAYNSLFDKNALNELKTTIKGIELTLS